MSALPAILVLGSGPAPYRRYILAGMARRCRPVLLHREPATWQLPFVADAATADLGEPAQTLEAGRALAVRNDCRAVVTWDESLVTVAAELAASLALPGLPVEAARACRNKRRQRELFAAAGVPSVRYAAVASAADAADAAGHIGYPVVVKPSRFGGSAAVALARDEAEVYAAAQRALEMVIPVLGPPGDVLVEEYVTGTEISVDSAVLDGQVTPFVTARKEVGFAPAFEEIGHAVGLAWPQADAVAAAVEAANLAVGADRAVTHTEVMLTARGPVLIEVNGRLGGDMIPYLGELATGVLAGEVAALVALGEAPDVTPRHDRLAGVRFFYPPYDMRLLGVRVDEAVTAAPWVDTFLTLQEPGATVRLPPREYIGRVAMGIATAPDEPTLRERMDRLAAAVTVEGEPLDSLQPQP